MLSSTLEAIRQQRQRGGGVLNVIQHPHHSQCYVIEVEKSHTARLLDVITKASLTFAESPVAMELFDGGALPRRMHVEECSDAFAMAKDAECNDSTTKKRLPSLIFASFNPSMHSEVPKECLKYISRVFFVPHTAIDLVSRILSNPSFQSVIADSTLSIKLQTCPKGLEAFLLHALVEAVPHDRFRLGETTHLLQVSHSRYGTDYLCLFYRILSYFLVCLLF
jgi:hypothetical protein